MILKFICFFLVFFVTGCGGTHTSSQQTKHYEKPIQGPKVYAVVSVKDDKVHISSLRLKPVGAGIVLNNVTPYGYPKGDISCCMDFTGPNCGFKSLREEECTESKFMERYNNPFYRHEEDLAKDSMTTLSALGLSTLVGWHWEKAVFDDEKFRTLSKKTLQEAGINREGRMKIISLATDLINEYQKNTLRMQQFREKAFKPKIIDKSGLLNSSDFETIKKMYTAYVDPVPQLTNPESGDFSFGVSPNEFESDVYKWRKQWGNELKVVRCSKPGYINNYSVEIICPSTWDFEAAALSPSVIIKGKDYDSPLPKQFRATNKDISIINKRDKLKIINKTNSFITIKAIALYYNSKVPIEHHINPQPTIAPKSEGRIGFMPELLDMVSNDKKIFNGITKKKAKRISFLYGFAVQYLKDGSDKTLFSNKTIRLVDM